METKQVNDWYETRIELPVRNLVRLLRDNGFNTHCSCGHEMYVECQYIPEGEIQRLDDLLFNNDYRDYEITIKVFREDGYYRGYLAIDLKTKTE